MIDREFATNYAEIVRACGLLSDAILHASTFGVPLTPRMARRM